MRANGKPVGFGFAMVREVLVKAMLFGIVCWTTFGVVCLVDVLWPLWDEENRALHDFIVDTAGRSAPRPLDGDGARRVARAPRLGPDDLVAPRADADQRDRHADEVGHVGQVVAGGLRQVALVAESPMSSSQPGSCS